MTRAVLLTPSLALLVPAAAHAGTYEVWSCAGPNGKPVPADGWRSEGAAYFSSPSNDCAGGNGLYAGLNGAFAHAANAETLTWHFQVPQSLKIAGYRLWRAARTEANSVQREPGLLDGAPAERLHRRVRRRPGELPGLRRAGRHHEPLGRGQRGRGVRTSPTSATCSSTRAAGAAAGTTAPPRRGPEPDAVYFRMYRGQIALQDDAGPGVHVAAIRAR